MHAVTVEIAGLLLGVDVKEVREVWRARDVLRVPLAPDVIIGLVNRRGAVVTLVDGHRVIEAEPVEHGGGPREFEMLILEHAGEQLAIAVDRLVDTFEVGQDKLMPLPPNLSAGIQRIATGVHAGAEELTVMASAAKIYETVRASAANGTGAGAGVA
jgi:chemotaxis signal transduction protein